MSPADAAGEPDEPGRASPPVLKNPSFRRLWLANFAGDMGIQDTTFALSITAVVFLHAAAFEVGLIAPLSRSAYLASSPNSIPSSQLSKNFSNPPGVATTRFPSSLGIESSSRSLADADVAGDIDWNIPVDGTINHAHQHDTNTPLH